MAYASGEKRNLVGAPVPPGTNVAASSPCPPSQPRKGTSSRPVLSARPSTSANGGQAASGPLVASVLGNSFAYHNRTASPGPQRNAASPQHASSQRSSSASLQRSTSSSRQRSSHGQLQGKQPFFAAYGLQYSGNGRNSATLGSSTSRGSTNMSPYRNRPSSSTAPASTAPPVVVGRPSTSQTPQRAAGENWFGNTKLSVTLPNEAARVVQELGQLLSVFAPPSPSTVPPGIKAPGSFRASKYVSIGGGGSNSGSNGGGGGSGGGSHKEAWGSGGGSSDMGLSGSTTGPLLRPTSASSTGSSSKPMMAAFLGDGGRHGANLSLMRLQQQQQQQQQPSYQQQQQHQGQGMYGTATAGAMLPSTPTSSAGIGALPYPQQQAHVPGSGPGPQGGAAAAPYLHPTHVTFQGATYQMPGSSGANAGMPAQPPRLNLAVVGSGSPAGSPKEHVGGGGTTSPGASPMASPHGMAHGAVPFPPSHIFPQPYPHAPSGPPPSRPWDTSHPTSYLQPPSAHGPSYGASVAAGTGGPAPPSQMLSPRPSGGSSTSGFHYLPSVDGTPASAASSVSGGTAGYTTMTVAATGAMTSSQPPTAVPPGPPYGQSASFPAGAAAHSAMQGYATAASASLSYNTSMATAAMMALGSHPPLQPLPVPTAAGPVPYAPPSSLAPSSHSAPLHISAQTAGAAAAIVAAAAAAGPAMTYSPAAKAVRESLMTTASGNSSSGNVSSPSPNSSCSQVQPAPPASALAGASSAPPPAPAPSPTPVPPSSLAALRSYSLANAPHPVGLPPPSPLKIAPPPPAAPGSSRGGFIRSNSSRSSNGSGSDTVPYYNSVLATVQDAERDDASGSSGGAGAGIADRQTLLQTPARPGYGGVGNGSGDGATPSAPASASTPTSSAIYSADQVAAGGGGGGSSSGSHVTWGATTVTQTSAPTTPTRVLHMSYNDLSSRRASSSSQNGTLEMGSPFARGVEGYSRDLIQHGTLTCVRPSTVPSNFAADSQPDLSAYAAELQGAGSDAQGSGTVVYGASGSGTAVLTTATSTTAPSWTPSSLATATSAAGSGQGPSTAAAAATTRTGTSSQQSPWRRSVEELGQATSGSSGGGSSSGVATAAPVQQQQQQQQQQQPMASVGTSAYQSAFQQFGLSQQHQQQRQQQQQQQAHAESGSTQAATAAAATTSSAPVYGTPREDAGWNRSRDAASVRSYGQVLSTAQQQQQQVASQQQNAVDAVAASTAAAAAAMAAASAAAAAVRQAAAAAAEAHGGSTPRGRDRDREYDRGASTTTNLAAAGTSSNAASQHHHQQPPASAAAATTSAGSTAPSSSAASTAAVPLPTDPPSRPKASTDPSPRYSPWGDSGTTTTMTTTTTTTTAIPITKAPTPATAPSPTTLTTTVPSTSTAGASSAGGTAGSSSSPTTGASSSHATSSAAGSAVSSGSTSSGTVGSGYTAAGSASGSSGSGSASGSVQHVGSARRVNSIVARFNPVNVLGSEPDPTFGNLLPGYSVGKVIGEGGFCQVRLAVHHLSQRKVAVKVIDRAKLVDPNEAKRMQREIRVMKHLSHQCVIKLFEVVESPRHLFLVMEHAPSGSLLDYVRARKRLPEADACLFFQQIVASLEYCHSREVVHRDIKLENILLDADQRMKLIDFGLSAFFVPGKRLRVHCGSPSYAAPEIVARKAYEGPPVDVWSLGVVLFAMVAGYLPFHASGGNKQELCNKIIAGQYTAPEWLSSSMKDLLARMLTTDPDKRITFPQVWQHSWVRNGPQWHDRGVNCYDIVSDLSVPGGLRCDEQVVAELEAAGYSRSTLTQYLAAGEANHLTASYFLLCEAKAEALRRMRGSASTPRGRSSSSSTAAVRSSTPVVSSSSMAHGSVQLAAAVAKARAGESPMRGASGSSRPSTAVGGGGGGDRYASARGHHRSGHHQGEDMAISGTGRMAVAV